MTLGSIILSVLAGTALGLRYKVLILVPAVAVAVLLAVIIGIGRADSLGSVALATVILGAAVQFGYLAGVAIRAAIESIFPAMIRSWNPEFHSEIGPT